MLENNLNPEPTELAHQNINALKKELIEIMENNKEDNKIMLDPSLLKKVQSYFDNLDFIRNKKR